MTGWTQRFGAHNFHVTLVETILDKPRNSLGLVGDAIETLGLGNREKDKEK